LFQYTISHIFCFIVFTAPFKRKESDMADGASQSERAAARRRLAPEAILAQNLDSILADLYQMPEVFILFLPVFSPFFFFGSDETKIMSLCQSYHFLEPVDTTMNPNYLTIILTPMDLSTIRHKIENMEYPSDEAFIRDLRLMQGNSQLFNGPSSDLTKAAEKLVSRAMQHIASLQAAAGVEDAAQDVAMEVDGMHQQQVRFQEQDEYLGQEDDEYAEDGDESALMQSHHSGFAPAPAPRDAMAVDGEEEQDAGFGYGGGGLEDDEDDFQGTFY
jgi:hypothetical protein